jgi:hypothetical protein
MSRSVQSLQIESTANSATLSVLPRLEELEALTAAQEIAADPLAPTVGRLLKQIGTDFSDDEVVTQLVSALRQAKTPDARSQAAANLLNHFAARA